ncbi:MAG: prolyl oligopeptidase family serine peptidase [Vulcanimicrobiaceae bacterium]
MRRIAAASIFALAAALTAGASAATFSLDAMNRLASIPSSAISPDGSRIAYVVERADLPQNAYADELWLYTVADGSRRQLPSAHGSFSSVAWSPDGTRLAYISGETQGGDRIYVMDPASGVVKAAGLASPADVLDFAWRPDGSAIAFVRRDVPPDVTGVARYQDAFQVTDNAYLATRAAQPAHLWLADLSGGERRLTQGTQSVVDTSISWSPDGTTLLYLLAPNGIYSVQGRARAFALDVASGASRPVTAHAAFEDQAFYSPDGSRILYLYQRDGDPMNLEDAMVIRRDGTGDRDVTQPLDRFVETAAWASDGSLLLKTYDATAGPLYVQPLDGPARRLPMGPVVDALIAPQGSIARNGAIVFTGTEAGRPDELYYLAPNAAQPQRITDVNADAAALTLGRVSEVRWTMPGGFSEDGVLTYPPGYIAGKKYPLVLRIHGGPTESSEAMFDPFYQLAASHGYLVFAPNYRGSNNLGNAYVRAIYNDASVGPGRDIMAGVRAVERMGIVDESRLAVSGWSYGGQMTSWMIGHYPIWRAAVTGAAVNDLVVDSSIADDTIADRDFLSPAPYAGGMALYLKHSPIAYYKNIHTPLLLLGNVYDVRVPIVEQYEMYHALRDNHVPVEFYAYPTGGHLPSGPVRLADAYRRWLDWFDRYLK